MNENEQESDMSGAACPAKTTVIDGYIVDVETGEIVGMEGHAPDMFTADNADKVDWVLTRMQEAESEKFALELRRQGIVEQFDRMLKEPQRRLAYLTARFRADLEAFASRELEGKKTRTYNSPYGSLSFRATPGGIKTLDTERAVAWAEAHAPDAVKTVKSVLVTPLKGRESELPGDIFEVTPPRDSFAIKPALGKETKP